MIKNIYFSLLGFLGVSAIGGGGSLIILPSGELPLSILGNSPFTNFLIPSIILFLVLGIFPIFIISVIKKPVIPLADRFNLLQICIKRGHLASTLLLHSSSGYKLKLILYRLLVGFRCFICSTPSLRLNTIFQQHFKPINSIVK